ncbi:MAG: hypothetical protein H0X40_02505 [Chthoniobacterales bacterium]|nr:hypothetical protein [Chthoniobacterales bacterium]
MNKFALIFAFILPALALAQGPKSGLTGSIVIGPVTGGPMKKSTSETKPLPNTAFEVKQGEKVVATFQTDEAGHFQVSLGAGHYEVAKKEKSAMGFFGPFQVDIADGKMENVEWKCDSGLR